MSRVARQSAGSAPYRAVRLASSPVRVIREEGGTIKITALDPLAPYPDRLSQRLEHWAAAAPERTFLARREDGGDWRHISYRETLAAVRAIGQALLERDLGPERPIVILSGNDIEHALLGLAAQYVGIPYAPLSPAYSLISKDFGKLRHIIGLLTPGLVFAADGAAFGPAIAAAVAADGELVVTRRPPRGRPATAFADLLAADPTPAVAAANARVGPDTVAKLLFTSGSTGMPKGVINTQRMLCANQVMLRTTLAFMQDEPPVIVDWLPWNHTFGGNHNVGLVLYNGGTIYIDDGRPTPAGIAESVRNLREISPTVYFNVPKGYEALIPYLRAEPALRRTFFNRLNLLFYSGAGMAQHLWDALDEEAIAATGERVVMLTGLGATESAPFALCCRPDTSRSGNVGLPVPGVELKLVPVESKLEARLRGPSITPGYWREPDLTAQCFDEEGFYRMGDALRFVDPDDPHQGFIFDGRVAEDFKLSTGTWVSVGPLRAQLISHLAPYVADVVIAGIDRDTVGIMVFPDLHACRRAAALPDDAAPATVNADPAIRGTFQRLLSELAARATGSSTRVTRALLLDEPPSIDRGEMTDKGSINQRAVLACRAALVERLFTDPADPAVICVEA